MTSTEICQTESVEWSVLSRPLPGELVSGDLHLVTAWSDGVLIAVVDGLGHGEGATAAARVAIRVIEEHAGQSLIILAQECHRALRELRGAVMTLASLNARDETIATLGIGNVEAVLMRARRDAQPRHERVLLRGGVVGYQLPFLQVDVIPIMQGDLLVFATDGVREDFSDLLDPADTLPQVVEKVMARKFRGTDDGLVLACRYLGGGNGRG